MNDNTGFAAFAMYNALKLHFTTDSYDYLKYNGKTNISKTTFSSRKDKYSFYRLSRKYNMEQLRDFYIANFTRNHDINWIGDIMGPDGESNYREWQKRVQSLTYTFENDIIYLLDKYGIEGEKIFRVDGGNFPVLLEEVMRGSVHIETLIMLNNNVDFISTHWTPRIKDDIIWPEWKRKILKYSPFLQYNEQKIKEILKDKVKEYAEA